MSRAKRNYLPLGAVWMMSDRTGRRIASTDMRTEWNGSLVEYWWYEKRNPQDFVRGIPDYQNVPFARPEPPPLFVQQPLAVWDEMQPWDNGTLWVQ